jgi:hypothetical protein
MSWKEPGDDARGELLEIHRDYLELRFMTIDPQALSPLEQRIHANIDKAFQALKTDGAYSSWNAVYDLEQKIGCLLDQDRLREEIARRLQWAVNEPIAQAVVMQNYFTVLVEAIKNNTIKNPIETLRDFFLELMLVIHRHSKRRHDARIVRGQATRRTLVVALIALIVALTPYLVTSLDPRSAMSPGASMSLADMQILPYGLFGGKNFWSHFPLYTGVTFGFLGALFSNLLSVQKQWGATETEEIFHIRTYHYIILRASIGVVGALVLYFFLRSGLVEGSVFPKFAEMNLERVAFQDAPPGKWPASLVLPSTQLALLIVWSFIAGFSESLVPTVLSNTERQFGGAISSRP